MLSGVFRREHGSKGIRFRDVTDGESATILVSEAQREIPWTKPEDIPCDEDTTGLKLGGFHKGGLNILVDGRIGTVHFRATG